MNPEQWLRRNEMEERIMKKLLAIFLSLALLYFLSACGGCGGSSFSADSPERILFDVRKHVRNRLRAGPGYFERPVCSR